MRLIKICNLRIPVLVRSGWVGVTQVANFHPALNEAVVAEVNSANRFRESSGSKLSHWTARVQHGQVWVLVFLVLGLVDDGEDFRWCSGYSSGGLGELFVESVERRQDHLLT